MTLTLDRERVVVVSLTSCSDNLIMVGSESDSVFVSGGGGGVSTARDIDLEYSAWSHS
jgi:hypothetical protein